MCDDGFALDCVGGAGGISSNKIETCHSRKCVSVVVSSERCKTRSASAVLPRVYLRAPPSSPIATMYRIQLRSASPCVCLDLWEMLSD